MTDTNVIQQVAEVKCSNCNHERIAGAIYPICSICGSKDAPGLRWPELSRECPWGEAGYHCSKDSGNDGDVCNGSGRVPDVTLEKVMTILCEDGVTAFGREDLVVGYFMVHDGAMTYGKNFLEAACTALLA